MRKTMQFLKNIVGVSDELDNTDGKLGQKIKTVITGFEEEDFLAWVEDRFGKFQKSWNKAAIEELHPFETESLFEMHKMYFNEAKEKGIITKLEGGSIKSLEINRFVNMANKYEIGVCLQTNTRGRVSTMDCVEPSYYYLLFEKEKCNYLPTCPCCTAPVLDNSETCDYCHTKFPIAMNGWKLAKIEME